MRADIGRVITERPRKNTYPGVAKGYKKQLQKDGLDHVSKEKMRKQNGDTKEFTDVLGPIVGFLKSRCGRLWDKVYSEISEALPASGGVSYSHARDHLFQMVELHTQVIDGVLCDSRGKELHGYPEFYVDQKGFLRKTKVKRYRSRFQKPVFKKTDDGEWIITDKQGVLFACTMDTYESNGQIGTMTPYIDGYYYNPNRTVPTYPRVYDVFLKETISSPKQLKLYDWDGKVYCCRKRQLNKREIKRYKLREK